MGYPKIGDICPDFFGYEQGTFPFSIRQNNDEFLSAVSGAEIAGPLQCFVNDLGDFPQAFISAAMTVRIIVHFEVIDIAHDDGQGIFFSLAAIDFRQDVYFERSWNAIIS